MITEIPINYAELDVLEKLIFCFMFSKIVHQEKKIFRRLPEADYPLNSNNKLVFSLNELIKFLGFTVKHERRENIKQKIEKIIKKTSFLFSGYSVKMLTKRTGLSVEVDYDLSLVGLMLRDSPEISGFSEEQLNKYYECVFAIFQTKKHPCYLYALFLILAKNPEIQKDFFRLKNSLPHFPRNGESILNLEKLLEKLKENNVFTNPS